MHLTTKGFPFINKKNISEPVRVRQQYILSTLCKLILCTPKIKLMLNLWRKGSVFYCPNSVRVLARNFFLPMSVTVGAFGREKEKVYFGFYYFPGNRAPRVCAQKGRVLQMSLQVAQVRCNLTWTSFEFLQSQQKLQRHLRFISNLHIIVGYKNPTKVSLLLYYLYLERTW